MTERYRAGVEHDAQVLGELVRELLPSIEQKVRGRLGSVVRADGDTQDIVQEALLEVLVHGPSFATTDRSRFCRLLLCIVENNIRDRYRHLHRGKRDRRREAGTATDSVLELDPPLRSISSPSQHAAAAERREWVVLAIELLAPEDRDVIRLRDWDELEFEAVGERLGISGEAARKRYHRALPRLADKVVELKRGGG